MGIARDRRLKQALRALEGDARGVVHRFPGAQKEIVGLEILWPLGAQPLYFGTCM